MAIHPIPADRDEWLKMREPYLGASEICALMGIQADFHQSPYALWAVKSGKMVRPNVDNDRTRAGNAEEADIAEYIARANGWTIDSGVFAIDDHAERFAASLDRSIAPSPELEAKGFIGPGALEIKRVEWDQRHKWEDGEPPGYYLLQLQSQLACTGWQWGVVGARIGRDWYITYPAPRHEGIISAIRESVNGFWARVDLGEEPSAADYYASTTKALKEVYPLPKQGALIDLRGNNELPVLCAEYVEIVERRKKDEKREAVIENTFRAILGPNESAIIADGITVERKVGKDNPGRPATPGEIIGKRKGADSIKINVKDIAA